MRVSGENWQMRHQRVVLTQSVAALAEGCRGKMRGNVLYLLMLNRLCVS